MGIEFKVINKKTGERDKKAEQRIKKTTSAFEATYPSERIDAGTGTATFIRKRVNDIIRQFTDDATTRGMEVARKVSKHPKMQKEGLRGKEGKVMGIDFRKGGVYKGKQHKYAAGGMVKELKM